ncbi:HET-domain-containing protein [Delitschia confertaspora ATCC 74209]|uniref:HET-domain-containing protein n=1 Tax=Delitschia confertaspora ATCC 74209 TaxID=1513339 RepID=A0A9P4JDX1_9PLEO|nr:HET-domain-containing protein [Delitschia confertaspora ATCC 74209]
MSRSFTNQNGDRTLLQHSIMPAHTHLCEHCLEILDKVPIVIERSARWTGSVHITNLGKRFQNELSGSCKLCHVLWKQRQGLLLQLSPSEKGLKGNDSLWARLFFGRLFGPHAIRTSSLPVGLSSEVDFVTLVVVPDALNSNGIFTEPHYNIPALALYDVSRAGDLLCAPELVPAEFNPTMISNWIQSCREHHGSCSPAAHERTEITLIDCATRRLTTLDMTHPYVALSYVWGNVVPKPLLNSSEIPENTSAVIVDALQVTQSLGFKYLWADQYCINQNDPVIKMRQISQMNLIYSQAELTIVAACGESAAYGLPGVSRPRERFQHPVKAGNWKIIELGPDGLLDLIDSKWATRGWTFQEAWLSKRLLCFTDKQCYFECGAISCAESLKHTDLIWQLDSLDLNFRHLNFGPYAYLDETESQSWPLAHIDAVHRALHSYSSRELRFDSDSLNAFAGVLSASKTIHLDSEYAAANSIAFTTALGIPLMVGCFKGQSLLEQTLMSGFSWFHVDSRETRRRTHFPSWTWAGWDGVVDTCWKWFHHKALDLAIQKVHVIAADTSEAIGHQIPSSDIDLQMQTWTLSFEAITVPSHWLTSTGSTGAHLQWFLQESLVRLYSSEPLSYSQFLGNLQNDQNRLVLIGYAPEGLRGLVWILRRTILSWSRAGIISIEPSGPEQQDDKQHIANQNLNRSLLSLIVDGRRIAYRFE